jgi:hypothetical protein
LINPDVGTGAQVQVQTHLMPRWCSQPQTLTAGNLFGGMAAIDKWVGPKFWMGVVRAGVVIEPRSALKIMKPILLLNNIAGE